MTSGRKRIAKLIAKRDEMSLSEAMELVEECHDEMQLAIDENREEEVEDIIADYLGLELDYVIDMLLT